MASTEAIDQEDAQVENDGVAEDDEAMASSDEPATTSPSSSSLPPMTKMQVSLMETLSDMSIRSEVQDCMNVMLMDVETTFYLRQGLELQAAKHAMETATKHHQATILEANAEREARENAHLGLADQMVQEVMSLSKELEDLVQWKRDHAYKVQEYDGLVAKLARTEEELEAAQERVQSIKESPPTKAQEKAADTDTTTSAPPDKEAEDRALEELAQLDQKPEAAPSMAEPTVGDSSPTDAQDGSKEETTPDAAITQEETAEDSKPEADSAAAAAVVTLDEEEPEEVAPGLVDMDVEVLMTIFGFLDAMDILNMAQINLSMYTKIDNIFGISEDGQTPPQPTRPPAPATPPATKPPTPAPAPTSAPISKSTPAPASPASTSSSTAPTSGPIGNRLLSLLQPARTDPGNKKPAPAVNANVIHSIASKLTDAEMTGILNMTDRLNKMEREVGVLRQEREAMAAKLDGTEAVKQFLINKVRDVEVKLYRSREDETKVTQQIASDQEVIAFLDSRVQELERHTETLTKDKSRAQSELETTKVQTSKKITMLSDMLKYEREKLKDEESEWKATKKVLVKEVKSCRAQILALQAERDGLKEQNEMLKRAIVSTGKSPRSTSPLRS